MVASRGCVVVDPPLVRPAVPVFPKPPQVKIKRARRILPCLKCSCSPRTEGNGSGSWGHTQHLLATSVDHIDLQLVGIDRGTTETSHGVHSQQTIILVAKRSQTFERLEYTSAGFPVGNKKQVRLVLLDSSSYLVKTEARTSWGCNLLHSGPLPPRHVSRPNTPDTVIGNENGFPWLQHVGHYALHSCVPCSWERKAHGVLGLEDVLNTSLYIVHDLCKLRVEMAKCWERLRLQNPVRHIGWSWTCECLEGNIDRGR